MANTGNMTGRGQSSIQPGSTVQDTSQRNCIDFLGVKVDAVSTPELLERITTYAAGPKQATVMYVNAACMLIAEKDQQYRETLNQADLVYADGTGVVLGARLWGHRLPGRSTAADFIPELCRRCADRGISLFFLGARPGVADEAARRLSDKIPGLKIAGTHHGYFKKHETEDIISLINSSKANLLVVGFGAPQQEFWIRDNASRLTPRCIWGVGGLFDFVSGRTARGPKLLLDHGFEWLCRLAVEPRRLWKRYIPGNIRFIILTLKHRYLHGN